MAALLGLATMSDGMLNTFRHVPEPGLAKMPEGLADMRVPVLAGCCMSCMRVWPLHVRLCLRGRLVIRPAVRVMALHVRSGVRSRHRRR